MSRRRLRRQNAPAAQVREPQEQRTLVFPKEHRAITTAVVILVAIGVVMVYSASSASNALSSGGQGTGLLLRTLGLGVLPGFLLLWFLQRIPLDTIGRHSKILMGLALFPIAAVLLPGVGQSINGAQRWINLGVTSFQPSEIGKLALVLYVAHLAVTRSQTLGNLKSAFKFVMWPIFLTAVLIAKEPDLGTALVCVATGLTIVWMAGMPLRVLAPILGSAVMAVLLFAVASPYRAARLTAFLHPWAHQADSGFQSVQGQIALGSGGILGVGPGQSVQKIFYLPEAHTDFILAVIGEELGVIGILVVLGLFGAILRAGMNIARDAVDPYAKLTAAGLTALITCQAMLNIWVVLGIAPLTGVPLPFISYGPTNLIVLLCSTGLLLNIAATGGARLRVVPDVDASTSEDWDADSDRSRRDSRTRDSRAQRR